MNETKSKEIEKILIRLYKKGRALDRGLPAESFHGMLAGASSNETISIGQESDVKEALQEIEAILNAPD